jgi:hypothetical protein
MTAGRNSSYKKLAVQWFVETAAIYFHRISCRYLVCICVKHTVGKIYIGLAGKFRSRHKLRC